MTTASVAVELRARASTTISGGSRFRRSMWASTSLIWSRQSSSLPAKYDNVSTHRLRSAVPYLEAGRQAGLALGWGYHMDAMCGGSSTVVHGCKLCK